MEARQLDEALVQALLGPLKELVQQDKRFLITNQSMYKLIALYETELMRSIGDGSTLELIGTWKTEVPAFRTEWLDSAEDALFCGRWISVVTESATNDAMEKCAERKKVTESAS
jgi:hypothetical protein